MSLAQLKVMSAIETCRTAALGGHVERCEDCAHERIAYNSCRNRHCPKCQAAAARQWLEEREAELLPVPYFHVVFTLPAPIAAIAFQNKAAVYDLLFRTAAETLITIAADPKHLGARIGFTAVLHTWGSALTHHPHVHGIVPGGGLSPDGQRWIACRPGFFLPVRVLSRLFRRLFLDGLDGAFTRPAGSPSSATSPRCRHSAPSTPRSRRCAARMGRLRQAARSPDRKPCSPISPATPTASPSPTRRLLALDETGVTFHWKDYRVEGRDRLKTMTLAAGEFIRRFLMHVLPSGFHRIRHYGLFASARSRRQHRARPTLARPVQDLSRERAPPTPTLNPLRPYAAAPAAAAG